MSLMDRRVLSDSELAEAIRRFSDWLEKAGYASYDPYDIWGTRYGLFSRRLYYARNLLGVPLVAPILFFEMVAPQVRSFFVKKQRFATADAQLLLAYLNLYHFTRDQRHLDKARGLARELLEISIPGFSGHCWGYPFDWQNNRGLWKKNTPFITSTPYCYEAFAGLADVTGDRSYLEVASSAARFVFADLKDKPTGPDAAAASYGPFDDTQVVNASAYRAWVLFDAAARFALPDYAEKARRNLNFILQAQRSDGAWLYGLNSRAEAFIDHFHTCFVLKNLFKINQRLNEPEICNAIHKGWGYYRRELFDANDIPKSFAIQPRTQIVRLEMYNMAEAITLGALLRNEITEAFDLAQKLARRLHEQYQLPFGHFVTRVFVGGWRHTFPFLRWPQAQLFYSLTNLLLARGLPQGDGKPVADGADQRKQQTASL